jgi:hypothetical protein
MNSLQSDRMRSVLAALVLVLAASPLRAAALTFVAIDVPGASRTAALGINPQGEVVGWYDSGDQVHGYLFDRGEFTTIDPPAPN